MSSPRLSSSSSALPNRLKPFPSRTLVSSNRAESALVFPDSVVPVSPIWTDGTPKAKGNDVKLRSQISANKITLTPIPSSLEESFTPMVKGLSHKPFVH